MRCPHCGFEDPEDYAYCSDCGQPRLAAAPPGAYPAAGDYQIAGAYAQMAPPATPGPRAAYATPGLAEGRSARLVGLEGPVEGQEFELSQPEMVGPAPSRDPPWSGPGPSAPPAEAVRSELAGLKRDLDPFIARLNALA